MSRVRAHLRQQFVGYFALFIAMGGVSYAAAALPGNSVGTKQLKKHAVTLSKISDRAQAALRGQTGPQGPKGDAGVQGPPGPTAAAVSGANNSPLPDPTRGFPVVKSVQIATPAAGRLLVSGGLDSVVLTGYGYVNLGLYVDNVPVSRTRGGNTYITGPLPSPSNPYVRQGITASLPAGTHTVQIKAEIRDATYTLGDGYVSAVLLGGS